jgi:hypothetical protein
MRLTHTQIEKYQAIYKKVYGVEVSKDEAMVQGLALLRVVKVLAATPNSPTNYVNEDYHANVQKICV